jgi:MFS family permease
MTESAAAGGRRILRYPVFRRFFFGQAVWMLGDGMAGTAVAFAVLAMAGGAADLGLVLAARTIPLVLFLLMGGVLADCLPRSRVMLGADLVRCGARASAALLVLTHHADVVALVAAQAVCGAASALFMPAVNGLIRTTVPAEALQRANALRSLAQSTAMIAGPALGGLLVAAAGPGWALAFDALSYLASAAFLARVPAGRATVPVKSMGRDLADGWAAFRSWRWVWSVIGAASLVNMLFAGFSVLGPTVSHARWGGAGAWA